MGPPLIYSFLINISKSFTMETRMRRGAAATQRTTFAPVVRENRERKEVFGRVIHYFFFPYSKRAREKGDKGLLGRVESTKCSRENISSLIDVTEQGLCTKICFPLSSVYSCEMYLCSLMLRERELVSFFN